MWWVYASLAPGLALAALIAVWQGHHLWRGREVPPPEGAR
jgi:TRAP-type C4-dicarboxylate transport system permease small subunit